MKQKLRSPIHGVSTLREEEEILRGSEEPVVGCGLEEGEVAVLKDEGRPQEGFARENFWSRR